MSEIKYVKIHPSIGIARVGNHPEDFFIGPELPFEVGAPQGGYKARHNGILKIKRQAARFRLYAYDSNDKPIREITASEASIRWKVTLANKKASWEKFDGPRRNPSNLRNDRVSIDDRRKLEIRPGEREIQHDDRGPVAFDGGTFMSHNPDNSTSVTKEVGLGELRTDSDGRLLVLGGLGNSESPSGTRIINYANNPGWYDDTSDGPVDAEITIRTDNGDLSPEVVGAWVVCAPPNFAPPIQSVVTLYDTLYDRAVSTGAVRAPSRPSFAYDIYPLLASSLETKNLYSDPYFGKAYHNFSLSSSILKSQRTAIFSRIRVPTKLRNTQRSGSTTGNMPRLRDATDSYSLDGLRDEGFTITPTQYKFLEKWEDGKFKKGGEHGSPPQPGTSITPEGLDQAALVNTIGGAFFPGIEASWFLEAPTALQMSGRDFLRIDRSLPLFGTTLEAGDVTKVMAVPWQADFYKCTRYGGQGGIDPAWWPSARPNEVPQSNGTQAPWAEPAITGHEDMVRRWWRLGFVVDTGAGFVEDQRNLNPSNVPIA